MVEGMEKSINNLEENLRKKARTKDFIWTGPPDIIVGQVQGDDQFDEST